MCRSAHYVVILLASSAAAGRVMVCRRVLKPESRSAHYAADLSSPWSEQASNIVFVQLSFHTIATLSTIQNV